MRCHPNALKTCSKEPCSGQWQVPVINYKLCCDLAEPVSCNRLELNIPLVQGATVNDLLLLNSESSGHLYRRAVWNPLPTSWVSIALASQRENLSLCETLERSRGLQNVTRASVMASGKRVEIPVFVGELSL